MSCHAGRNIAIGGFSSGAEAGGDGRIRRHGEVDCVSGGPDILPKGDNWEILADHLAIHAGLDKGTGAHILTGPVAVAGAAPGDVLQIDILNIDCRQNWGYTRIRPHAGTLPEDFPMRELMHSGIDRQRGVCTLPWGQEIDLAPFFGVMGVARRRSTAGAPRSSRASSAATWT